MILNVLFVGTFAYPLYQTKKMTEASFANSKYNKHQFTSVMKWNVSLSLISSISTSMGMFSVAAFKKYWWTYTIDFPINGLALFFMIGTNRRFLSNKFACKFKDFRNQIQREIQMVPASSAPNTPRDDQA